MACMDIDQYGSYLHTDSAFTFVVDCYCAQISLLLSQGLYKGRVTELYKRLCNMAACSAYAEHKRRDMSVLVSEAWQKFPVPAAN